MERAGAARLVRDAEMTGEKLFELITASTGDLDGMRALLRDSWINDLPTQLVAETEAIKATGDTADAAEAIAAFAAKRKPHFTGR